MLRGNVYITALALLAPIVFSSCGSTRESSGGRGIPATTVEVQNRSGLGTEVYVLDFGRRVRLGRVGGGQTKTFTIPERLVDSGTPLRFVMKPSGPAPTTQSEAFTVAPGENILLVIPSPR